jgi:AbrB family looped-hinge helix DNA binding protein
MVVRMRQESKLSAQGPLTVPAEIRRKANLHAGTRFSWEVDDAGNIILKPMRLTLADVAGMFKSTRPVRDQEIRGAKLVHFLDTVLDTDAFIIESREVIEAARFAFAAGRADFADHVILESARRHGADRVYTFDLDFSRMPGAERLQARKRR